MCLDSLIQIIRAMTKFYLYTKNYTLVHFILKDLNEFTYIYKYIQNLSEFSQTKIFFYWQINALSLEFKDKLVEFVKKKNLVIALSI